MRFLVTCVNKINEFFKRQDFDGALDFLGKIFHDPANQKQKSTPTDYMYDENDDSHRKKTAGDGFDEMTGNFKLRGKIRERIDFIIERLEESRNADRDTANKFQPFNAIVFKIDLYEFGSVVADSRCFIPEKGLISRQYGLNHTIIADSDFYPGNSSSDCYDFIYDLQDGKYKIMLDRETLDGKVLHFYIKSAMIGKFLNQILIPDLLTDKRFAAFPKAFPFRFIIPDEDCYDYEKNLLQNKYFECHSALTAESMKDNCLKKIYLKSAASSDVNYPDELFIYLLKYIGADETSVQGFNDLCSLIAKEQTILDVILKMSEISLARSERLNGTYKHPETYFSSQLRKILFNPEVKNPISSFSDLRKYIDGVDAKNKHSEINRLMDYYFNNHWYEHNVGLFTAELERVELELKGNESELFYKVYCAIGKPAPVHFLQIFWKLFEIRNTFESLAVDYTEKIFKLSIPLLPADSGKAIERSKFFTANLTHSFSAIPESHRARFTVQYEARMNDLRNHSSSLYKALAYESDFMNAPEDVKVTHNDGWGHLITLVKNAPGEYTQAVCGLLDLMPEVFSSYNDVWYFVMPRVQALGSTEPGLIPKLLALLDKYSSGTYFDENLIRQFADILYKAGLEDIPPAIHTLNDRNEFYMEYYKEWVLVAPKKKFASFIIHYGSEPDEFKMPDIWEKYLYNSKPGFKYYFDQMRTHAEKDKITENILTAAKKGAGEILTLYLREAAHLTSHIKKNEQPFYTTAEEIIAYLAHVHDLDDDLAKLLLQSKIAIALRKIDNSESDAYEYLQELKHCHAEFPIVLYFDVILQEKLNGIKAAMEAMIADWKLLTANDPVYAKAFLLYTLTPVNSWDAVRLPETYAVFRLAQKKYEGNNYSDGVYSGRFNGLNNDPIKEVISSEFKFKTTDEMKAILHPYMQEFDAWISFEGLSNDEIAGQLTESDFNLSLRIIKRLVADDDRCMFEDELMNVLDRFKNVKDAYLEIMNMLWPIDEIHDRILDTIHTHAHLHDFIKKLSYDNPEQVKDLFACLNATGRSAKVFETAQQLDYRYIINNFKSVLQSIISQKKQIEGAEWLISLRKKIKEKNPDYILVSNNIGVLYLTAGKTDMAEKAYNDLFAIDWSAFTEGRSEKDELSDEIMDSIMGGSLDKELFFKFNTYFASAHFNMACLFGTRGDAGKTVEELSIAVKYNPKGYPKSHIENESDFNSVRESDVFKNFIKALSL
jgi:hypothetical protein